MKKDLYRECELKFRIKSNDQENKLLELIHKEGYIFNANVIETDFILDTKERLCKQSSLLFRIRNRIDIKSKKNSVFITIKIKGKSNEFQDNYEIEFSPQDVSNENIDLAIDVLVKITGISIVKTDLMGDNLQNILRHLFQVGFSNYEIMQKKRKYYIGSFSQITLDKFPNNIGSYIEIEAINEDNLYKTVQLLGLKMDEMEKRNYGKLILETNKKNCIFEDAIFWDDHTEKYINVDRFMLYVIGDCNRISI